MLRVRSHGKALLAPALALILLGGAAGVGTALVPSDYRPVGQHLVLLGVGLLAVWRSVLPFLRWRARTYTVTTHRLRTRGGVLRRAGVSLPLLQVQNVSYRRSLPDRFFGCGTLLLRTAADRVLVLEDVPEVERVHRVLTDLLFAAGAGRPDAEPDPGVQGPAGPRRFSLRSGRGRRSDPVLSSAPR